LGIAQDGRTSRKLQAIAIAIARFLCFVFDKLTNCIIRVILDVLGEDLQLPIADQSTVDQSRKHQIIENSPLPV
jgi:hypothetical protein